MALGWRLEWWDKAKIKLKYIKTVGELPRVIREIVEEEEKKRVIEMGRVW